MANAIATKSSEEVITYKCPGCGAPLVYSAATKSLLCEHCGSTYSVAQAQTGETETVTLTQNAQQLDGAVAYRCQSCGAQLITTSTTVATACPYCDNNVVLDPKVSGTLKPDGIIPFAFDKSKLAAALQSFYANKPLLPDGFFDGNKVEKAQGVYVPFWLYDAKVDGPVQYSATRTNTYIAGNYQVTETKYYRLEREGSVAFQNVPVDGSSRMDNDLMDSIEAFDVRGVKAFDSAYLSGYVADRYDEDARVCYSRAASRMINSTRNAFDSTTAGYEAPTRTYDGLKIYDARAAYVLFPVWLFNGEYEGKKYRYAVNGQTGKVVGELPISKAKSFRAFFLPFVIAIVLCTLFAGLFMGDADSAFMGSFVGLFLGSVIGGISVANKRSAMKVVQTASTATTYAMGGLQLRKNNDVYLRSAESRVMIQTPNNRGMGGGMGGGMTMGGGSVNRGPMGGMTPGGMSRGGMGGGSMNRGGMGGGSMNRGGRR